MAKKMPISVVIADDHAILRAGLRMLLNAQPDMRVVGEAADGEEALAQVRLRKPDVLLLDISMPGTGGVEAAIEVKKRWPRTRVVILTMHAGAPYLDSALAAGASGYVLKKALDSDLVSAIRAASDGSTFIDSGVAGHLVAKALGSGDGGRANAQQVRDLLSRRELQVLRLAAAGLTNRQIASKVFVGVKSVETYRSRVLKKLNIKTRQDLVRFALDAGLLVGQDPRKAS